MVQDLKKIVNKANKEHFLEMKNQQEIINNIPQSEEWFLQTYERLKKLAGKSLNQVDFKEFTQLSTVIHDQKEVEQLIKTKMPAEQLVGAASNLWKSLSGVKWLSELRRLISQSETKQIDMNRVKDLNDRAQKVDINYEKEIQKKNIFERYFTQFQNIVNTIESFENQFGDRKKLINTLEDLYEKSNADPNIFDKFQDEVKSLNDVLKQYKIISESGEFGILEKLHTWIDFLRHYKSVQDQYHKNLPLDQVMLLQKQTIDKEIPDELNIKQFLTQRKNRFVKFTREYDDYMRLKENLKKKSSNSNSENSRFTCKFIKQLIEECKSLSIEKDQVYNYDEKILEDDIKNYEQWRQDASDLLYLMQADEMSINDENLRDKFMGLQKRMRQMPIYDKESFIRVQSYNWLYQCLDMLESSKLDEPLSLNTWEKQVQIADQYTQYFKDIKSHSIFQRMLWEVQQAKEVIEFVNQQKINQKQWAAKFNLDKQQNYAYFRNKNPRIKIQKMLEIARQSKVDLQEEIRSLDHWLKDYEKYTKLHQENSLTNDMTLEKLKDIERIMYLSPIDYTEIYLKLKERIDTAEMIKLNLKKIFTEHEAANAQRIKEDEQPKRLKFSRIQYDLKLFKKSCNIVGIKEIEIAQEKVQQSNEKLDQIREKLQEIDTETANQQVIRDKLETAKRVFTEIEIDMENEEIDVKRMIFEAEIKLIFQNFSSNNRKLQYDEFKDLDKVYDKLRDHLIDENLHSKFKQIRYKVIEIVRKINQLESEADLQRIQNEVDSECPIIDFTQLLTDKDARIKLGKRKTRDGEENKKPEHQTIDLTLNSKRRKKSDSSSGTGSQKSNKIEVSDSEQNSSSSGDESGSSSSSSEGNSSSSGSSSGSSNSSSSGSENGSDSEEVTESEEEETKTKTQNLAKNRTRRNIVPNLDSDFIYENPAVKKIHQERSKQQEKRKPEQIEEQKEQNLTSSQESIKKKQEKKLRKQKRKEKREQKRKEEEKKEQMRKQLTEFRLQQNKSQQTIQQRNQLSSKLDHDQIITFGSLISQDKALQDSLLIMKNKIREQTRHKLKEAIDQTEPVFSQMDLDSKKKLIIDLETEMFTKHPEVDTFYRKKCTDACENIKFLAAHKDIAEMVAIKRTMPYYRLFQPHPQFKDTIQNVLDEIKEKKRQERMKARQEQVQRKQQQQEEQKQKEVDQAQSQIFNNFDLVQLAINREQRGTSDEPTQRQSGIKVSDSDEDDDDLESVGSNQALFSDEDDQVVPQSNNQIDPFTGRPYNQIPHYGTNQYGQAPQGYPQNTRRPIQFYNPYEVVDQINNRFIQNRSVQAIMFDPNYRQQSRAGQSQEKNVAPPGSLLKVWEGQIEISRDQQPHVQLFSTIDIRIFQTLPQLPQTLTLKGKSNISDVVSHFLKFKNDRKLIRGWITRRGNVGSLSQNNSQNTGNWQENSDKYTKLFDELESFNKVALFNVFNGVTFYLVPITSKTKEFCKQMGIVPEQVTQKEMTQGKDIIQDLEAELQEETHCYAILCNIKQSFNNKLNILNPDVLRMAQVNSQERTSRIEEEKKTNDMSFSPITSDEEGNPKTQHKAQILQSVKQEEVVSQQNLKSDPNRVSTQAQVIVKSDENFNQPSREQQQQVIAIKKSEDEDDDDDIDIDVVIEKMRAHENDILQIQAELLPIIHRLKGEKEQKLTRYLEDLIQKYNNPPQQTQPPQIKQETIQIQAQQNLPQQFNQQQPIYQSQGGYGNQGNSQFGMLSQDQRFQQQQQIPPFGNQQMTGQYRQMPPSQQYQQQMNQGQIRPQSMIGAVYPNQLPNMSMPGQQQVAPQFQQRQQLPPQTNPMFQPGVGVPPLRPPPVGIPLQQQQMMRPGMNPQGMIPPQQQFMGQMNPRQLGIPPQQMPFNQQQQPQGRQQYPHQQNQQQQQQHQRK